MIFESRIQPLILRLLRIRIKNIKVKLIYPFFTHVLLRSDRFDQPNASATKTVGLSYIASYLFSSPKTCIAVMPLFIIFLLILPTIMLSIISIIIVQTKSPNPPNLPGLLLWGITLLSPNGAM